MRGKLNYGPVKGFADGGKVELYKPEKTKMKPHVPAKVKDPIKTDAPPGGSQTPGAKGTYPMPKKKKGKK